MKIPKRLLIIMVIVLLLLGAAFFYLSFKLITQFSGFTPQSILIFVLTGVGFLGICIYLGED